MIGAKFKTLLALALGWSAACGDPLPAPAPIPEPTLRDLLDPAHAPVCEHAARGDTRAERDDKRAVCAALRVCMDLNYLPPPPTRDEIPLLQELCRPHGASLGYAYPDQYILDPTRDVVKAHWQECGEPSCDRLAYSFPEATVDLFDRPLESDPGFDPGPTPDHSPGGPEWSGSVRGVGNSPAKLTAALRALRDKPDDQVARFLRHTRGEVHVQADDIDDLPALAVEASALARAAGPDQCGRLRALTAWAVADFGAAVDFLLARLEADVDHQACMLDVIAGAMNAGTRYGGAFTQRQVDRIRAIAEREPQWSSLVVWTEPRRVDPWDR